MRVAVTYENGQVFQHFGHTEQFKVYDVQEGKIVDSKVVDTNGRGHGALAGVLNALICGGIGGGAQTALAAANIKLYGGVSGNADDAVAALLAGNLAYNPNIQCNHHNQHHGEDHACGDHGCGEHHCEQLYIYEKSDLPEKVSKEEISICYNVGAKRLLEKE